MEYDAIADALVAGAKTYIDGLFAALQQRVAALETRQTPEPAAPPPGIAKVLRNAEREVLFVLTNGQTENIGQVDGADGKSIGADELNDVVARAVDARMAGLAPKEVDPAVLEEMVERHVATLPPALPGKDADPPAPELLRGMIAAELATMPKPEDGKDADPAEVAEILRSQIEAPLVQRVEEAIAGIPELAQPKDGTDGRDADPAEVAGLLKAEMEPVVRALAVEIIAAFPPAKDGLDGKDADPAETKRLVAAEVTRQMAALPAPKDGQDAKVEDVERVVIAEVGRVVPPLVADGLERAVAALPKPQDGHTPSGDEILPLIDRAVDTALEKRPVPKDGRDGIGLTGALINRDGNLVLTLSDGTMRELGAVIGKDADMDALAAVIVAEIAKMPKPTDGKDGFDLDDLSFEFDGERTITLRFVRGDLVREKKFTFPVPIHRGLWKEGAYVVGDMVIRGGSTWCCRQDTTGMPNASPDWILTAKRGADGKNTETVKILPATVKLPDDKPKT